MRVMRQGPNTLSANQHHQGLMSRDIVPITIALRRERQAGGGYVPCGQLIPFSPTETRNYPPDRSSEGGCACATAGNDSSY